MKIDRSVLSPEQLAELEKSDRARLGMASFAEERKEATRDQTPPPGKDRGPSQRRQHIKSEITTQEYEDKSKASVAKNRFDNPLKRLEWLSDRQIRAAEIFEEDFRLAAVGGKPKISSMERIDNGRFDLTTEQLAAYERTVERLLLLPEKARSVVEHVVGMRETFPDWVQRVKAWGWPMDPKKAKGILDTALDILADHERIPRWYREKEE